MKVRTGEKHGIPVEEATDPANQFAFEVVKVPTVDYAEKALREAQDAYYKAYPDARKGAREHLWEIRKRDELD